MNTLTVDFPVAGTYAMPQGQQLFFLGLTSLLSLVLLVISLVLARRDRSPVPPLLLIGGSLTVLLEPVTTFLGHAAHPSVGAIVAFTAVDRVIPWHVVTGYTVLFGGMFLLMYNRYMGAGISRAFVWRTAFVTMGIYIVMETVGVTKGIWHYYEHQPIYFLTFTSPPVWWVLNVASEMSGAALLVSVLPLLTGWRMVLLPFVAPMGVFAGHLGAGYMWYNAINSSAPTWFIDITGVISIILGLFVIELSARVMAIATARGPGMSIGRFGDVDRSAA